MVNTPPAHAASIPTPPIAGTMAGALTRLRVALALAVSCVYAPAPTTVRFAVDLELCIRESAEAAAAALPRWGNVCMPFTFHAFKLEFAAMRNAFDALRYISLHGWR